VKSNAGNLVGCYKKTAFGKKGMLFLFDAYLGLFVILKEHPQVFGHVFIQNLRADVRVYNRRSYTILYTILYFPTMCPIILSA